MNSKTTRNMIMVLLSAFNLVACTTGDKISANSIPVGRQYYSATNYVDIYFGSYTGNKKYEQISFIEVLGGQHSKTNELVTELKRRAKSMGADAVINVHKGRMVREKQMVLVYS